MVTLPISEQLAAQLQQAAQERNQTLEEYLQAALEAANSPETGTFAAHLADEFVPRW